MTVIAERFRLHVVNEHQSTALEFYFSALIRRTKCASACPLQVPPSFSTLDVSVLQPLNFYLSNMKTT